MKHEPYNTSPLETSPSPPHDPYRRCGADADHAGKQLLDEWGRPAPNEASFPSSAGGLGLRPLADTLRQKGLRLGLWLMRGVPRSAVSSALPVANSSYSASDAVRYDKNCFWSNLTYGTNAPSAAASAYYGSLGSLFASWGVGLIKADCFFPNLPPGQPQPSGYFDADVFAFGAAMKEANISVAFSPGISLSLLNATQLSSSGFASSFRVVRTFNDSFWQTRTD